MQVHFGDIKTGLFLDTVICIKQQFVSLVFSPQFSIDCHKMTYF